MSPRTRGRRAATHQATPRKSTYQKRGPGRVASAQVLAELDAEGRLHLDAPVTLKWWTCGQSPCHLLGSQQWAPNPLLALQEHASAMHSSENSRG